MDRSELRYLKNAEFYLGNVFAVWGRYFHSSEDDFRSFFENISSDKDKDLFLRVGSFYRFLVAEGRFLFEQKEWNDGMSYIDETYKYIAIFSFIEALESPKKYVDFFQWLQKENKEKRLSFDKAPMEVISQSYKAYKDDHGSINAAVRFFSRLDKGDQLLIKDKFKIYNYDQERSIKEIAQVLYQIRSLFVHEAQLVKFFSGTLTVGRVKENIVMGDLSIQELKTLFERGFLERFKQSCLET
jgi:hypothetical protein